MNIKEAKEEILNTVDAYLKKDETGAYEIPPERQRPILLIGPPGIGKTAIMEQVARERGINLVSYTITHHTRQSAIGLPYISKKNYGGREYSVTEYTMSEIVASVYDQIERSGVEEGILFLDEINCVSETLAPTMLQFLQYKTFGVHRIPDSFLIVTAGNPPQYNKSVRDFDIVTLDRVKRIDVTEDFAVWKEYAYRAAVHGAILSYLEIRRENFYSIKTNLDGKHFVTARGWEDLSRIITVYEELGKPVTEQLILQYLQSPEIAEDFSAYYDLYNKYKNIYRIDDIINGKVKSTDFDLRNAAFDEKLSLLGLLVDRLNRDFRQYASDEDVQKEIFGILKKSLPVGRAAFEEYYVSYRGELDRLLEAKMLSPEETAVRRKAVMALKAYEEIGESPDAHLDDAAWKMAVKETFSKRENQRKEDAVKAGKCLTSCFSFIADTFGEGQEMVIFLTELSAGYYSLRYVSECGNDAYYRYNRLLLLKERKAELRGEIMELLKV